MWGRSGEQVLIVGKVIHAASASWSDRSIPDSRRKLKFPLSMYIYIYKTHKVLMLYKWRTLTIFPISKINIKCPKNRQTVIWLKDKSSEN